MAKAIDFIPEKQDRTPSQERELRAAPLEHVDAVLSAYDLLEEAHHEQIIDMLRGAIGAKARIIATLADFGSQPASIRAARNLMTLAKAIGAIDPDLAAKASTGLATAFEKERTKVSPPSLWQLLRRANHPDVRRGLSYALALTAAIGRSVGRD